jgi:hypothetical protein
VNSQQIGSKQIVEVWVFVKKIGPTFTNYRLSSDDDGRDNGSQNKVSEITDFIDFVGMVGGKPHMATDFDRYPP